MPCPVPKFLCLSFKSYRKIFGVSNHCFTRSSSLNHRFPICFNRVRIVIRKWFFLDFSTQHWAKYWTCCGSFFSAIGNKKVCSKLNLWKYCAQLSEQKYSLRPFQSYRGSNFTFSSYDGLTTRLYIGKKLKLSKNYQEMKK